MEGLTAASDEAVLPARLDAFGLKQALRKAGSILDVRRVLDQQPKDGESVLHDLGKLAPGDRTEQPGDHRVEELLRRVDAAAGHARHVHSVHGHEPIPQSL